MQPESPPGPDAGPGSSGGPLGNLPDAVPDGVQTLLDGMFSFGGDLGRGVGEFVSGLANAIGQGGGEAALLAPDALDQTVAMAGVVA